VELKFFNSLSVSEKEYLDKSMKVKTYEKGEILFDPEDTCNTLEVVLEGELRLMKYPSENQEYILEILKEGDIFGEAIIFDHTNYPVYVLCSKKAKVGSVSREIVLHLMADNMIFMETYLNLLCRKIKNLNWKIDMLTQSNIKNRIIKYLIELKEEQMSNNVSLNITKQTLALLLGTSREVLSRNFSDLEREGYIKQNKDCIEIMEKALEE
jgi:CRP/FNR family transcriptional regulator